MGKQSNRLVGFLRFANSMEQAKTLFVAVRFGEAFEENVIAVAERKSLFYEDFHHLQTRVNVAAQQTGAGKFGLESAF